MHSSLPPRFHPDSVVPRFRGDRAPLAALAAQVRTASTSDEKASAAGRLARQLVKRDIEIREAIALAEKSLSVKKDPELSLDLAGWWAASGDLIRGAALLQAGAEGLPQERRIPILLEVARLFARSGQVHQAVQALRQAMTLAPLDPTPLEIHGSLGFWAELPVAECAKSYLSAARLRKAQGQDGPAFENRLRAFEVDPSSLDAATELADALRERDRPGAADEILREHLRRGSAAQRAAHHQRVFYGALFESNLPRAFESALEAYLDLELDPTRLEQVLAQSAGRSADDFESFLTMLAREGGLGHPDVFADWLVSLVDLHIADWGEQQVAKLRRQIEEAFHIKLPPQLELPVSDARLREVRQTLAAEMDDHERQLLREEIARREAARGCWQDAFEVFQPLYDEPSLSLHASSLGAVIAGRARHPKERARALALLAATLPATASAVTFAVAAEMLLAQGETARARLAALAAIDAEPTNERAVASQALVALSAPEEAAAGLLERSLSVLVARSETCSVLCQSASRRGAHRLALTWAARSVSLRPGDESKARAYLAESRLAGEADKMIEALHHVIDQAAPASGLTSDVAKTLGELHGLSTEAFTAVGSRVLAVLGVRTQAVVDALIDAAKACGSARLQAAISERQLVVAPKNARSGLTLALCRQRLRAEQPMAAARALRRALAYGADTSLVIETLSQFPQEIGPDGALALQEIRFELLELGEPENHLGRAEAMRHLGAARWDMAQDSVGAIQLWLRAADLQPEGGLDLFALYLRNIAGAEIAAKRLQEAANQTEDPSRAGKLLGLAARELFDVGEREQAFALAERALQHAPLLTEILAVAEASAGSGEVDRLLALYDLLAQASLGNYAERALHYRAARQLEKRGLPEEALEHACAAFEAVPAEGVAFVLMVRLADSTAGHGSLVATLQRVADAAVSDDERVRWIAKAAALADTESMGRRERAELLLRAAQMMPEKETLEALLDALAHFLADEPQARDEMWERYKVVATDTLRHATGAHGAQLNLLFGAAATTHFEQPDFTLDCLQKALSHDVEVPDYEALLPLAEQLSALPDEATAFVEAVKAVVVGGTQPLGRGIAELAGRIAELLGVPGTQTELLARAASDFPEDTDLIALAKRAAERDGRTDLLEQIQRLLPVSDRAYFVLDRLGSMTRQDGLDALLELDLDAVPEELRVLLLAALGSRHEELGHHVEAALCFRELNQLEPNHPEGLKGIERDAERTLNFEELVRILKQRAELSADAGEVRRLQLRRAAVLETRLGRANQARELLLEIADRDEDRSALRMLADSWERTGDHTEAAELWGRVHKVAADQQESDDAAFRAASCFVESGTPRRAAEFLSKIKRPTPAHRKLGLEVARTLGEPAAIRQQLIGLAEVTVGDNAQVGAHFLEAARLALDAGEFGQAESCARRARDALPKSPEIRLLVARLRVRRTAPKTREQGEQLLADLEGTDQLTGATEREICVFLRSQAVRAAGSEKAAVDLLESAIEAQGERALLALALAELLRDAPERALALYESAVGGELYGFRGEGEILLAAGTVARELGAFSRARAFVSAVSDDDPMRARAAKELEDIALEEARARREEREAKKEAVPELELSSRASSSVNEASSLARDSSFSGPDSGGDALKAANEKVARALVAAEQREALRRAAREEHRVASRAASEHAELVPGSLAMPSIRSGSLSPSKLPEIDDDIEQALEKLEPVPIVTKTPTVEAETAKAPPVIQSQSPVSRGGIIEERALASSRMKDPRVDPDEWPDIHEAETAPAPAAQQVASVHGRADENSLSPLMHKATPTPGSVRPQGRAPSRHPPKTNRSDEELVLALEEGHLEEGLELLERLQADRSRARDAVVVAQHLAALDPGDASLLGRLVTTASRDGNEALALAVRHVLGAYGSGDPVTPPLLDRLDDHGPAARALLEQSVTPAHEALSLVWEHAHALYKKDLGHYGVSGLERVPLNAPTPLGELYSGAARILGMTRTAVFRQGGQDDIAMQVALLTPPAVIVAGEVHYQSTALHFHFGAMLAAAAPEHVLLFGCDAPEMTSLLDALALSFGNGNAGGARPAAEVTRIASFFWESIPARAQRRLTQLCSDPSLLSWQQMMAASRQALRRAGLIVCGDLPTAVNDACFEAGLTPPTTLGGLADCARSSSAVADLLGLALSPEYAELRYRVTR